jgi:hypothetical protein
MHRDIGQFPLVRAGHPPDEGMTIMEMVAYVCGEEPSDSPACASPVLSAWMAAWADGLDDVARQELRRYVPLLARSGRAVELETWRQWLVVDWLVRSATPIWLHLAGLVSWAETVAGLPELTGSAELRSAQPPVEAAAAAAHEINAAAWSGIVMHAGSAQRSWEVVVSAALRTVETAMALIEPAARATGYASVDRSVLPPTWAGATAAITNCGVTLAWHAVGLLLERPGWVMRGDERVLWREVQRAVTAALDPPVRLTTDVSHQLVERMLGIETPPGQ